MSQACSWFGETQQLRLTMCAIPRLFFGLAWRRAVLFDRRNFCRPGSLPPVQGGEWETCHGNGDPALISSLSRISTCSTISPRSPSPAVRSSSPSSINLSETPSSCSSSAYTTRDLSSPKSSGGCGSFPLGIAMRSGFIPSSVGICAIIAGCGYVISSCAVLFLPRYAHH